MTEGVRLSIWKVSICSLRSRCWLGLLFCLLTGWHLEREIKLLSCFQLGNEVSVDCKYSVLVSREVKIKQPPRAVSPKSKEAMIEHQFDLITPVVTQVSQGVISLRPANLLSPQSDVRSLCLHTLYNSTVDNLFSDGTQRVTVDSLRFSPAPPTATDANGMSHHTGWARPGQVSHSMH